MLNNILMFRTTFIYIFPCYLSWKIYIFLSWYSSSSLLIAPQKKKGGLAIKAVPPFTFAPLQSTHFMDRVVALRQSLQDRLSSTLLHSSSLNYHAKLVQSFLIYENSLSAVSILNSESLPININLSTVKILIYHLIYYPIY